MPTAKFPARTRARLRDGATRRLPTRVALEVLRGPTSAAIGMPATTLTARLTARLLCKASRPRRYVNLDVIELDPLPTSPRVIPLGGFVRGILIAVRMPPAPVNGPTDLRDRRGSSEDVSMTIASPPTRDLVPNGEVESERTAGHDSVVLGNAPRKATQNRRHRR